LFRKTTLAHALNGATFVKLSDSVMIAVYNDPVIEEKMRDFVVGTNVESQTIFVKPMKLPNGWWLLDTPGTEETRGKVTYDINKYSQNIY
jgi:hypothetical protein